TLIAVPGRLRLGSEYGRGGGARGREPDGAHLQPGPGVLPGPRRDQARPGPLLPGGGRRDRPRAARAAVHAAPVPRRGGRPEGAPETGAGRRAAVAADGAGELPALRP